MTDARTGDLRNPFPPDCRFGSVEFKLFLFAAVALFLWLDRSPPALLALYSLVFAVAVGCGFSPRGLWARLRPTALSALAIALTHGFASGGEPLRTGPVRIPFVSDPGIHAGFGFGMSLLTLATLSLMITRTTPPHEMADRMARLFRPFSFLGFKTDEFCHLLVRTIQFVPLVSTHIETMCRSVRSGVIRNPEKMGWEDRMALLVDLCVQCILETVHLENGERTRSEPEIPPSFSRTEYGLQNP